MWKLLSKNNHSNFYINIVKTYVHSTTETIISIQSRGAIIHSRCDNQLSEIMDDKNKVTMESVAKLIILNRDQVCIANITLLGMDLTSSSMRR